MAAPWPAENSYDWDTKLKAYLDDAANHDAVIAANLALITSATRAALLAVVRPTPKFVVESGKFWILAGPGAVATQLLTQSQEVAVPFEVVSQVSITELDVEVTTAAASSTIRLGIRAHDPATGEPKSGAPLVDAGTIDSSTTGVKPKALAAPLVLTPGWYWYTITAQGGAPTVRSSPAYALLQPMPIKGATAAALSAATVGGYFQSGVTGALPNTWASSPNTAANVPRLIAKAT
jgi:hypothetical protein